MPKRPITPRTTASGKPIGNAPHRVTFATEQLMRSGGYTATRNEIMRRFKVSHTTAEKDLARAYLGIAEDAEIDRPILRVRETTRMLRIASAAERRRDFHAAIAASARLAKINALETVDAETNTGGLTDAELATITALRLRDPPRTVEEARAVIRVLALTPAERRVAARQADESLSETAITEHDNTVEEM